MFGIGFARVLKVDPTGCFEAAIKEAAKVIADGGLVAYPTESFYGLGAEASNKPALKKLFKLKKRSLDHPVLVLTPSVEAVIQYVDNIPPVAGKLIKAFWPGGLTLVFKAGPRVSNLLTAGTGKIGIRLSSHPLANALAKSVGVPISSTSANISGLPVCRNAEEVLNVFGQDLDLILDGGETVGWTGSTILDITVDPPLVLREGLVTSKQIDEVIQGISL